MTALPEILKSSLLKMSNAELMAACDQAHAAIREIDRNSAAGKKPPAAVNRKAEAQAQIDYARTVLERRLVG
jgi:hypothetical protein